MEKSEPIRNCLQYLALRCDGAVLHDRIGFNGSDSRIGRHYAEVPEEQWTPAQRHALWTLLRKYKRQLGEGGYDYDAIPEPPIEEAGASKPLRIPAGVPMIPADAQKPAERPVAEKFIRVITNECRVYFPYDPVLNNAVKNIDLARFINGGPIEKYWCIPCSVRPLKLLSAFAKEHAEFILDDNAAALLAEVDALPMPPERILTIHKNCFVFVFPYNGTTTLREEIKAISGSKFIKEPFPCWTVPATGYNCEKVVEIALSHSFDFDASLPQTVEALVSQHVEVVSASRAEDADLDLPGFGVTLRPFQRAGVAYALNNPRRSVYIGDDMGLGKTLQALGILFAANAYPCLVVCPASVKLNWRKEALRAISGKSVHVIGGKNGKAAPAEKADITIINYDLLGKHLDDLLALGIQILIVDEAHYVKSRTAARTRHVQNLARQAPIRVLLSGTPIVNRPKELASQISILGYIQEFGGEWKFLQRYTNAKHNGFGWDFSGASHLEELNERMRGLFYIRRDKSQVLKELPPLTRAYVPVEITNRKEVEAAERDLAGFLRERAREDRKFNASITHLPEAEREELRRRRAASAEAKANAAEQLVRITTLRQLVARGKIEAAKEWVGDLLTTGSKLVLFAWHKEIQRAMMEAFAEYNPAHVFGADSPAERAVQVERFQTDPDCHLIICSIVAAGEGITLTAAPNVAFLEHAWNPGKEEQAEARIHRIGQENAANAYYLEAAGTIDEEMGELINAKRSVIRASADGATPVSSGSILHELMRSLMRKGRVEEADILNEIASTNIDTEEE